MNKKLIAIVIVGAIMLSLAACSTPAETTVVGTTVSDETSAVEETTTVADETSDEDTIDDEKPDEDPVSKVDYEFFITKRYSPNGNVTDWFETQFDTNGKMLKYTHFGSDNSVLAWDRYEYDRFGNCTLEVYYDSDNNVKNWIQRRYYAKNLLAEMSYFDSKGVLYKYEKFDESGHMIKSLEYESDGSRTIKSGYDYRYDADGNKISEIYLDEFGNVKQWNDYLYEHSDLEPSYSVYDSEGIMIENSEYSFDNEGRVECLFVFDSQNEIVEQTQWVYDDRGLKEKVESGNHLGFEEEHTEYDSSGNEIRITAYTKKGDLYYQKENSFDSNGNLIKSVTVNNLKYRTVEEWDSTGNLLKEIEYRRDGSISKGHEYKYIYDASNRMIKKTTFDADGNVSSWYENEYDSSGKLVKITNYDSVGNITGWTATEYGDNYHIPLSTILEIPESKTNIKSILSYDSEGKIVSGSISTVDSSGNIVKDTKYTDGEISSWTEYEYYSKGDYSSKNSFSIDDSEFIAKKSSVTVTDDINGVQKNDDGEVYYIYHRIPTVNIVGKDLTDLNKKIHDDVISISDNEMYGTRPGIYNSYFIGDEVISIRSLFEYDSYRRDFIYNISIETGKFIDSSELIKKTGLTDSQFFEKVKEVYDKYWLNFSSNISEEYLDTEKEMYQENYKNISYEYIVPFFSPEGKLCFLSRDMAIFGGSGCDNMVFDLTNGEAL